MKNFLGIPIHGDIISNEPVKQRPVEEFQPLVRAALDNETIHSFGWSQFTPYFNDGDPCKFSAGELWVRLVTDEVEEDEDAYEFFLSSREDELGIIPVVYSEGKRTKLPYEGPDEIRFLMLEALSHAVTSGEFNEVLLTLFGDHAAIMFTREKIVVDCFDHE
jgi:hypothetical protein